MKETRLKRKVDRTIPLEAIQYLTIVDDYMKLFLSPESRIHFRHYYCFCMGKSTVIFMAFNSKAEEYQVNCIV
jgi:hypothetical protein